MASITKNEVKTTVMKPVVEVTTEYVLVLSEKEADTLAAILAKVGGSPTTSYRKHQESIIGALRKVGKSWSSGCQPYNYLSGNLTFRDGGDI